MRIVLIDNKKEQMKLLSTLLLGNDVRQIEFKPSMKVDVLAEMLLELIDNDTCLVFDLCLRKSEESRHAHVLEEYVSIKTIRNILTSIDKDDSRLLKLRFLFMSNYVIADNPTVEKIDSLFSDIPQYVATIEKPLKKEGNEKNGNEIWELDTGYFYGKLYLRNLEKQYQTTNMQESFVNMILYGRHQE